MKVYCYMSKELTVEKLKSLRLSLSSVKVFRVKYQNMKKMTSTGGKFTGI